MKNSADQDIKTLFSSKKGARHKIEITFGKMRTKAQAIGCIQVFESGAALHGGGDVKLYWCPFCSLPMQYSSKAPGPPYCEHCDRSCKSAEMVGERFFRCPTQQLAKMVELLFHNVGDDADIYLKYHPTDLRRAALDYTAEDQAVRLGKVRAGRQRPVIYPLGNILRDGAGGSSLVHRFKTFIES